MEHLSPSTGEGPVIRPVSRFPRGGAWTAVLACLACAPATHKPIDTPEFRAAARKGLEAYLRRVVGGDGQHAVKLADARLFREGHVYEVWKLTATLDGQPHDYALKLYPDEKLADRARSNYQAAQSVGWRLPEVVHRGPAEPYSRAPGVLMEYVPHTSLAEAISERLQKVPPAGAGEIAELYAGVGRALAEAHVKGRRPRRAGDLSASALARRLSEQCRTRSWCGRHAIERFKAAAKLPDAPEVTLVHGNLDEADVILDRSGTLTAFVDFDEAAYADAAQDVGSLLAHLLLVNPVTRQAVWGVPPPDPAESRACAEAFLAAYRRAAGITDGWAAFVERAKGTMWLRVGTLLFKLQDNVHARPLIDRLTRRKVELFATDPFRLLGIHM